MNVPERSNDARMLTLEQGASYAGMGKTHFRSWADKIGAKRQFTPRLVRYDRVTIDQALDAMARQEGGTNGTRQEG